LGRAIDECETEAQRQHLQGRIIGEKQEEDSRMITINREEEVCGGQTFIV